MALAIEETLITRSLEIMSGAPVFTGTRVPIKNLWDYLEGNHNLDEFLDDFPAVSRTQAIQVLRTARDRLLTGEHG